MPRWPDMDDSKRCTATSNRTGRRCARARMPGATVCSKHGAAAPQVRDAAAARVADAQAREIAARVDVDLTQFHGDPIEALRNLLARDQAQMERFGRLVDRFEDSQLVYTTKGGVEMLRAVLSAYQQERDSLSRRLDLMLKAGVAERLIQTREAQTKVGQQGTAALFGFCLTLFLSDVSSALADAGVFEQHDAVVEKLQNRVQQRLQREHSLLLPQIENLATQDRRNGQEPR